MKSLNARAETAPYSYATMSTAKAAVRKAGNLALGDALAYIPRGDGRIVVFVINPADISNVLHGTRFVATGRSV